MEKCCKKEIKCEKPCNTPSNNSCLIVLILFILLAIIIGGVAYI